MTERKDFIVDLRESLAIIIWKSPERKRWTDYDQKTGLGREKWVWAWDSKR